MNYATTLILGIRWIAGDRALPASARALVEVNRLAAAKDRVSSRVKDSVLLVVG